MISRRTFLKTLGLGAVSGAALASYAFAIEPLWRLVVTRYALQPANWTRGLKLKVAVLADIHACNPWMSLDRIERIVERTNALKPDLTLLLGDFSAGISSRFVTSYVHSSDWAPVLAKLEAPLGRYAVLGNHDWWEDKTAQKQGHGPTFGHLALENAGVPVLENQSVRLLHHGRPLWVAGLGDQLALLPRREYGRTNWQGVDDLSRTLDAVPMNEPMILMAHEPDVFPKVLEAKAHVALTVSGHTHGGQFRVLGHSPVVPSRYGNRYAYGHVKEPRPDGGICDLLVSGGLGCSIAPVRFGVPPEIVLLDLS
ncbi:MAG: metallophosphoesterase [Pseudomonadota bacterium]